MDDRLMGKSDTNVAQSAPSRRIRHPSSALQVPPCLVDGCNSDLSKCRDYHRRHKVCELHSKSPRVTIKGQEQRFCQQCSRFHSLLEFDDRKRSCRKRLDGHNRRRRKPQPEPLSASSARFLENYKGARFLAFDNPQGLVTGSSSWVADEAKAKNNDHVVYSTPCSQINLRDRTISVPECEQEQKQFSLHHGTTSSSYLGYYSSQLDDGGDLLSRSQKSFSNTFNRGIQSDCALSLLSSTPDETHEFGFTRPMQPDAITPARYVIPCFSDMGSMVVGSSNPSLLGSGGSSNSDLHCHGMFHAAQDDSSSGGSHHHRPFSWD